MTLAGLLPLSILLTSAASAFQSPAPAAPRVHRRRAPAPDPEKEALRKKLAEATAAVSASDSRVLELMAETGALRQEAATANAGREQLQRKLDAAVQSAASLQARLDTAESNLKKMAAERDKVRAQPLPAAPRPAPADEARLEAQLQDITRRRDGYIASVLRRYRDLANQYRSFGASAAGPNGRDLPPRPEPDLTRIQSSLAMAEEELRQLDGLEAQAVLVRKEQAKVKARTP